MKQGLILSMGFGMLMALPVLASAQTTAPAPTSIDVTGKWAIAAEVEGVAVDEVCTLTQTPDGKITGSCDVNGMAKYDTTGAVTDKTVVLQHGGEYEGTKLTMTYTGKFGTDGLITGTLDVDPMSVSGAFTAKKSAPTPAPAP